jgi:hypothetical protein
LRKYWFIPVFILFTSCEFLGLEKKEILTNKPIATVFNQKLYKEDIVDLLPRNIDSKDSIVLVRSIINNWATKQLLLRRAEENNSSTDNSEINNLVRDYREALLINGYKERLIQQQLDTLISEEEITNYYAENSQNFRLNEELVKTRYLHFADDLIDKKEVIKLFKKGTLENLEELEMMQLSFKGVMLNDSVWSSLENVLLKTPFSRDKLLKKTKFLQKEDSLGVYLVAINDVLRRNDIAPKSYIKPTIKQMILHQRKLQLIRDIEKIIVKDAIQNKSFQIH